MPHLGWAALLLRARGLGYLRRGLRESSAFQTSHSSSAPKPLSAAPARLTHGAAHRPFLGSPAAAPGRGGSPSRTGPAPDVATGLSRARHSSAPPARCLPQPPPRPDPLPAAVPLSPAFPRGAGSSRARPPLLLAARRPGPRPPPAASPRSAAPASRSRCGGSPWLRRAAAPVSGSSRPGLRRATRGRGGDYGHLCRPALPPERRRDRTAELPAGPGRGARVAPAEGCAGASGVRVPEKGPPLLTCASCMTTRHCCHPRPWTARLP